MIGNKTVMDYMAHRLGVRELTDEDKLRLASGDYDKTIVHSSGYFNRDKNTEQLPQHGSAEGAKE